MYALVSISGVFSLVFVGYALGAVLRPDVSDTPPLLLAALIVANLWAGLNSGDHLSGGRLRKIRGDLFYRHIPASPPSDPDDE